MDLSIVKLKVVKWAQSSDRLLQCLMMESWVPAWVTGAAMSAERRSFKCLDFM
jgi:hypothetical protein